MKPAADISELKAHLSYEPETGSFTWLRSASGRIMSRHAGTVMSDGYVCIYVLGRLYQAHHLAWAFIYGAWPTQIDHINRKRGDNRLSNLRLATNSQNAHNKREPANNTSGFKGIRFKKNRWEASCMVCGKRKYLGRYSSLDAAKNAYDSFARSAIGEFHLPTGTGE